ncbi:reverse transcriptase domain-containing protein [Tanacetum coccineum]
MVVQNLEAKVDSRLVANQINGPYIVKDQNMIQYQEKARTLISSFKKFSIKQVPRSENKKAHALSKIPSTSFAHLIKQVLVKVLKEKSIKEKEILAVVEEEGDSWMTPLFEYLRDGTLPAEVKRACAIKIKSRQYAVIGYQAMNDEAFLLNLDVLEEEREKPRFKKQKAKQRWNSTTTPRSAAQSSNLKTLSTAIMKPAMQRKSES